MLDTVSTQPITARETASGAGGFARHPGLRRLLSRERAGRAQRRGRAEVHALFLRCLSLQATGIGAHERRPSSLFQGLCREGRQYSRA